jgi:DNA (cytosine-5)-methyltransferase 1
VEIDEFCNQVLAKHWPNVPRFTDVRSVGASNLVPVDLICGGFPCQDISQAGKGPGITGVRSGLWSEYARIIGELRPRYVLVENVRNVLKRGAGRVFGDLAALGYDAEWTTLSACAMGAPHMRRRVFIVAHPGREGLQRPISAGVQYSQPPRWGATPRLRGRTDGVPNWVDRLRTLGNAVSPDVAEFVGRLIVKHAEQEAV